MARMTVLPLFLLLSIAAAEAETSCTDLEAKILDLQAENAKLREQLNSLPSMEVPYFSMKAVAKSLGVVSEASGLSQVDLGSLQQSAESASSAVNASCASLYAIGEQAADLASSALSNAKDYVAQAKSMAEDTYKKSVEPHAREYFDIYPTIADTYATHVEPHVSTAQTVYYEKVHPHINSTYEQLQAGIETIGTREVLLESLAQRAKALLPVLPEFALQHLSLTAPFTFEVLGRKFHFAHGWADVALAAVQAMIGAWIVFAVMWQLFLKTFFWKIGVQLVGRKIMLRITGLIFKVTTRLLLLVLSMMIFVASSCFAMLFSLVLMASCSGLGVGMLHGLEKGLTMGLSVGMRLGLGFASGLFFYLFCRCKMCKRRAQKVEKVKKADNGKAPSPKANGKTSPKAHGKPAEPDAKQASKAKVSSKK